MRFASERYKEPAMLRIAFAFFAVALIAAALGFSGIAIATAGTAKILFFVFMLLFLISLAGHLYRPPEEGERKAGK